MTSTDVQNKKYFNIQLFNIRTVDSGNMNSTVADRVGARAKKRREMTITLRLL